MLINRMKMNCDNGCDIDEIVKISEETKEGLKIFQCQKCKRKYSFEIGFDSYDVGDVVFVNLICLTKTSRSEDLDDHFSVVLREVGEEDLKDKITPDL